MIDRLQAHGLYQQISGHHNLNIIDVRAQNLFAQAYIPGALNIVFRAHPGWRYGSLAAVQAADRK